MYGKVRLFGHPVHPTLASYAVTFYTMTLVSFLIYDVIKSDYFWIRLSIVANIAGLIMAGISAIPGFVEWLRDIPQDSEAKQQGLIHMSLNGAALILFAINAIVYAGKWTVTTNPSTGAGIILSLLGLICTFAGGYFGWAMVLKSKSAAAL